MQSCRAANERERGKEIWTQTEKVPVDLLIACLFVSVCRWEHNLRCEKTRHTNWILSEFSEGKRGEKKRESKKKLRNYSRKPIIKEMCTSEVSHQDASHI